MGCEELTTKRMVYLEIMTSKRCKNAANFMLLVKQKNTSLLINELSMNEIQDANNTLGSLFSGIQKVHSMTDIDINKVECKFYANSKEKIIINFKYNFAICTMFLSYTFLHRKYYVNFVVIIKLNHVSEIKCLYNFCKLDKGQYLLQICEISNA